MTLRKLENVGCIFWLLVIAVAIISFISWRIDEESHWRLVRRCNGTWVAKLEHNQKTGEFAINGFSGRKKIDPAADLNIACKVP